MDLRRLATNTAKGVSKHRVPDLAAMLTYYTLFATFPAVLFVVTLALLVLPPATLMEGFNLIAVAMPKEVADMVREQLVRMEHAAGSGFAVIGVGLALWGFKGGITALMTALNVVYDVEDSRPWWKRQLIALTVTLAVGLLLVLALALLVVGPFVTDWITSHFHLGGWFGWVTTIGRLVVAALLVMLVWAMLYYFLPNAKRRFRWITPGTVTGVGVWLLGSRLFMIYTDHFASYDKTYGALGAVIIFLTWLWLSNMCFLLGGEIDDALEDLAQTRQLQGKEAMESKSSAPAPTGLTDLARRIGNDVSTLARGHLELARLEFGRGLKSGVADAGAIVLGGLVGLIGFAMLCTAAVAALAPVIHPLWLRLIIMAVVYLVVGGLVVLGFVKKLRGDVPPDLSATKVETRRTLRALKDQVQHG